MLLATALPETVHAWPGVPMCIVDDVGFVESAMSLQSDRERFSMCGPDLQTAGVLPVLELHERAVLAYQAAKEHIEVGRYDEARLELDLAWQGLPSIRDHIAMENANLELLRNRPERAAEFFENASHSPHPSLRARARNGQVRALLAADEPSATAALNALFLRYPELPEAAELRYEHARSLLRQSRNVEAIDVLVELEVTHPGHELGKAAARELARLERSGHPVPALSATHRLRRARQLLLRGPMQEARREVQALLKDAPMLREGQLAQVHELAGRLARFEGRWEAAEAHFRAAQQSDAWSPEGLQMLQTRAEEMAATSKSRRAHKATASLRRMRAGRPLSRHRVSRLCEMVELAASAGLSEQVNDLLTTVQKRDAVPTQELFDCAMSAIGAAGEGHIIFLLRKLVAREDTRYQAAALYHLGRAHERAGHPDLAQNWYQRAQRASEETGVGFYGLWAQIGLSRLAASTTTPVAEALSEPSQPLPVRQPIDSAQLANQLAPIAARHASAFPWIQRATDLLRLDERSAATAELYETYLQWREARGRPVPRAGLSSVATGANRPPQRLDARTLNDRLGLSESDLHELARVAEALGDIGTSAGFSGPEFVETQPRAYEELVVPAANRYGLDPNLLLAVMRVESVYQKHVVSYAGAIGLTQIMPRTGSMIAHALGDADFTPADLLDPETNLEFSAWYLASLIRRFDGRLPLAIAAYNGGPHNVRRWMEGAPEGSPLDVLLERIPFEQTHRYVRRVLVHYQAYRAQQGLAMPQLSVTLPPTRVDPLSF